jgi:hypothetical protein
VRWHRKVNIYTCASQTMAWRFKASKFKNTQPDNPKKDDSIYDVPIGQVTCTNNGIAVDKHLIAFHIDSDGECTRAPKHAHSCAHIVQKKIKQVTITVSSRRRLSVIKKRVSTAMNELSNRY